MPRIFDQDLPRNEANFAAMTPLVFLDLWTRCRPTRLQVYARYTRRGGLDINPWRTSHPAAMPKLVRTARQ